MAKKGAPYGNKNAAGPHRRVNSGKLAGVLGAGLGGPVGSVASGMYAGAFKSAKGQKSANRSATATGAAITGLSALMSHGGTGAVLGAIVAKRSFKGAFTGANNKNARNAMLAGMAGTALAGAALGGALNYGGTKLGQYIGKRGKKRHT